eukprot:403355871
MNALLLQPKTYMNIIGVNVSAALKSFQVEKQNIIILHDDLERKLGNFRVVKGTSFNLGGFKDFTRFGIGIGRPEQRDENTVANYVLSNFSKDEIDQLEKEVFSKIYQRIITNKLEADKI